MMNEQVDCIIKRGIVENITDKFILVRIHNESACSSCHSRGICTSLGSNERIVEVDKNGKKDVQIGESVDIKMVSTSGWLAVLYGYILPFVILIGTLLIANYFLGEGLAAIISLLILVPYFFGLYLFRTKLKKYFRFTLS